MCSSKKDVSIRKKAKKNTLHESKTRSEYIYYIVPSYICTILITTVFIRIVILIAQSYIFISM